MASTYGNHIDPKTGTITYHGFGEITKGDHTHMPSRTDAYLSTDERGHIQASSLGGTNARDNVVPQAADLNHGAYYRMEQAERSVLQQGGTVQSEKIAFVSNQPGGRPDAFLVNDTVTYADGQSQQVHLSFANLTTAEQESMNAASAAQASDMWDSYPNPGDGLRSSMSGAEYSALMEETDAALPGVGEAYEPCSGSPSADAGAEATWSFEDDAGAAPAEGDFGADAEAEAGVDGGDDGGISADDDDV